MPKTKFCPRCNTEKDASEFSRQEKSKDGLQFYCNVCKHEKGKEHYSANKDRYNKRNTANHAAVKREVFSMYGNKCACCGEDRIEFLGIDHINGDGAKERRELGIGSGFRFYYHLRDLGFPSGYRLLCHNCNLAISNYGYCPHHPEIARKVTRKKQV